MFQQAFSRLHSVTVLAANTGASAAQSGSGIYSGGDAGPALMLAWAQEQGPVVQQTPAGRDAVEVERRQLARRRRQGARRGGEAGLHAGNQLLLPLQALQLPGAQAEQDKQGKAGGKREPG